jgi:Zn-dependent membrane protease YugP
VRVEPTQGFLSDHYDPRSRTLRLSADVYHGRSVAAAGVAAHEVGHAIQHARSYAFLSMRSALVPMLGITSNLAMPTILVGFVLSGMGMQIGSFVLLIGIALFATLVLFQLVTLPVELDASRRALAAIEHGGLARGEELTGARKVLSAAALTYIAAALSSMLTLLYFLLRSGLLGGGSRDR